MWSRIIWHQSQKRRILCGRSATTSRGVLKAYSSQKPQSATVRLSMWKGAPNNAEGKAKQCIGVMMSFCSILLRFLNRTFQNAEIRCSVWKQTEAHWSIAAANRMNWKWSSVRSDCEFGDMKGVSVSPGPHTSSIGAAVLGFLCYRSSNPDPRKKNPQLQIWPHHLSDTDCFPGKFFISCWGTENSQMVPNQ